MIYHSKDARVQVGSLKELCEYLKEHRPEHYGEPVIRYAVRRALSGELTVRAQVQGASRPIWVFYGFLGDIIRAVESGALEKGSEPIEIR